MAILRWVGRRYAWMLHRLETRLPPARLALRRMRRTERRSGDALIVHQSFATVGRNTVKTAQVDYQEI